MAEYYGQTTLHPVGLTAVLIMAALTFLLPRKTAIVPLLFVACLIPSAQRLVIGGMDFNFTRIIALAGILRLLFRQEYAGLKWLPLDTLLVVWGVVGPLIAAWRWGESCLGSLRCVKRKKLKQCVVASRAGVSL